VAKKQVNYSNAEQFNADFKKRQSEIHTEISIVLQSEHFRVKSSEIVKSVLTDHDTLASLSKRLFENGVFTDKLKEHIKKEIELTKHKSFFERFGKFGWLVIGAIIAVLGEILISKMKS